MAIKVSQKEMHRVVATAIIYHQGKYLLLKRSDKEKAFPGKWTVPGGGLHPDDYIRTQPTTQAGNWYFAIAHSLAREVKEETNLKVSDFQYLVDLTFIRPDGVPVVVLSFFTTSNSGKVKLRDKMLVDSTWATVKEVKKYDLIDGIREEIIIADRIIRGQKITDREKHFKKLLKG